MLSAFGGGDDGMVLLDATGGTNHYGYQFYSLVVVDDYRQGVPVAFMVTSSQDADAVKVFMQVSIFREHLKYSHIRVARKFTC
jgi:hypothetical protein